jgi:transcriptional regulator with XRE-family HTH domain
MAKTLKSARKRAASQHGQESAVGDTGDSAGGAVASLTRGVRRWAGTALGMANTAVDLSVNAATLAARTPGQRAAVAKAGKLIRQAREAAGMSLQEVGAAIDLSDPELLGLAESGRVALPFEALLRLAAVLGRHDPLTFALQVTRNTNPGLWSALEGIGLGKLVVQGGRERELANIYRGNDAARALSDAEFARVVEFTRQAFDMATQFRSGAAPPGRRKRGARAQD